MKILPVRAELFHPNEFTDRHDEANSHPKFCERAQKNIKRRTLENTTHHEKMFKRNRDVVSGICPLLLKETVIVHTCTYTCPYIR
jgi:hypothetical protein